MDGSEVFDAASKADFFNFFQRLFSADFMPHGHCFYWRPDVLWLNVVSDGLIAFSYYAIPVTLVYFVMRRKDIPFHWIFLMFGAFIIACGTTHLMEIWTIWNGTYRLAGVIKCITAFLSIATAVLLIPLIPKVLAFPSQDALAEKLSQKERELKKVNDELEQLNDLAIEREGKIAELRKEIKKFTP